MNILFCPGGAIKSQSSKNYTKYFCPKKLPVQEDALFQWEICASSKKHEVAPAAAVPGSATPSSLPGLRVRPRAWRAAAAEECTGRHSIGSRRGTENICRERRLLDSLILTPSEPGEGSAAAGSAAHGLMWNAQPKAVKAPSWLPPQKAQSSSLYFETRMLLHQGVILLN